MTRRITAGIFAILASAAIPAFAQETSSEEAAPEGQGVTVLSTGEPIEEVGQTRTVSEHGDWELRCITAPEGQQDPCQLYQLLEDQNGNSVAEINVFGVEGAGEVVAGANIVTPLETLLTAQLRMQVDAGQGRAYPYTFCNQIGCVARIGLSEADIAAFKRGNQASIVIVPVRAPTAEVRLTVSLSGFTAGYDAVLATNAPTPAE